MTAPNSAGAAFVFGLISNIISLMVLAALAVHASVNRVSRTRDETFRTLPGQRPHTV